MDLKGLLVNHLEYKRNLLKKNEQVFLKDYKVFIERNINKKTRKVWENRVEYLKKKSKLKQRSFIKLHKIYLIKNYNFFWKKSGGFVTVKGNKTKGLKILDQCLLKLKTEEKCVLEPLIFFVKMYICLKPFFDGQRRFLGRRGSKPMYYPKLATKRRKELMAFIYLYKAIKLVGQTRGLNKQELYENLLKIEVNKGIGNEVSYLYQKFIFDNYQGMKKKKTKLKKIWFKNQIKNGMNFRNYMLKSNNKFMNYTLSTKGVQWNNNYGVYRTGLTKDTQLNKSINYYENYALKARGSKKNVR